MKNKGVGYITRLAIFYVIKTCNLSLSWSF